MKCFIAKDTMGAILVIIVVVVVIYKRYFSRLAFKNMSLDVKTFIIVSMFINFHRGFF